MSDNATFRNWLFALAVTTIAVVLCIVYVDRPVAEFCDAHVRRTSAWIWLGRGLAPFNFIVVIALLFLLACGAWVKSGRPLHSFTRTPLLCSWAAMWATAAQLIFKQIFGRAWPDPTYIHDHLYGFRLLHASPRWDSFPSGTATISAAIAAVLWIVAPRWRVLGALTVALLCVAVVITNHHWVGDVVAGAFLGTSIGVMTVQMPPPPRS
jgi:membrane-associated phospholipid phosphatase